MSERLSDKDLEQIAKKGIAYTREARLMAQELIERRKQDNAKAATATFDPMQGIYP
jgi:hypothetical protein